MVITSVVFCALEQFLGIVIKQIHYFTESAKRGKILLSNSTFQLGKVLKSCHVWMKNIIGFPLYLHTCTPALNADVTNLFIPVAVFTDIISDSRRKSFVMPSKVI